MVRNTRLKTSRAFPTTIANPPKRIRKDTLLSANKRLKPDIPIDTIDRGDGGQHALDDTQERLRQPGQVRTPPPEPPASVQATHALIPPEADDPTLRDVYDIHAIAVVPNSKIQDKVGRVLSLLEQDKSQEGQDHDIADTARKKPIIVALMSRESGTNKCISIAEIAKRELQRDGGHWRQYTGSWSRLETVVPEKERRNGTECKSPNHQVEAANNLDETEKRSGERVSENESSDDEGFEQMAVPDRKLVRNVACLVIYLSRQAVSRLKELYGFVPFPMFHLTTLTWH